MFSLLGMIARLGPNHILNCYGRDILLSKDSAPAGKSWFLTLRTLTQKYSLPDPLLTLQSAPTKNQWKRLTKARVIDWWEVQLRGEAAILPSLTYFNPSCMSLSCKHPIWTNARSPFEVSKAVISARMLSGRYRTDRLVRHWSNDNEAGLCRLCQGEVGSLEHMLLYCPALSEARSRATSLWSSFLVSKPALFPLIVRHTICPESLRMRFLLDPSCLPEVITADQNVPNTLHHCLYLTRTWNFTIHIARMKMLKLLNLNL